MSANKTSKSIKELLKELIRSKENPLDENNRYFMIGTRRMLKELSRFMGRGKSFEDLLTVGMCGVIRALQEYKSYASFEEQLSKYSKLYLFRLMKNTDYCPDEMDKAKDMKVNNIKIAKIVELENSLQEFAEQKIDCLVHQYSTAPHVAQRAVYGSLMITVNAYSTNDFGWVFREPKFMMTMHIKAHVVIFTLNQILTGLSGKFKL